MPSIVYTTVVGTTIGCIFAFMILITFLFPNALMLGVEFFEENDDLQFNEFNLYLFFVCIAYRWRSDGGKIDNLEL